MSFDGLKRALQITLHLGLLLAVLSMTVFLARRHGPRIDLTTEGLYSLTDSTQRVLERLDERLHIEAFFSPDEALGSGFQESRRTLRFVLDEYRQQGRGRVTVQYFDPSDEAVRKRAERIGLRSERIQDLEGTTLSSKEIWQGFRLLYGGKKQKVVPFVGFDRRPAMYEAALTPLIKALTVTDRPRIGVIAWLGPAPAPGPNTPRSQREGPSAYDRVLNMEEVTDRYELVGLDISEGQHVPQDIQTLILIRPLRLSDRQKYVIDQFLMRGGKLAVFADTADVSLGSARRMLVSEQRYDAKDAKLSFQEQLASYGIAVSDEVVFDGLSNQVPFAFSVVAPVNGQLQRSMARADYPYWFQPTAVDWASQARQFATDSEGRVDEARADIYRGTLKPGVTEEALQAFMSPALFWPCPVEVAEDVPDGVDAEVLMRTSPRSASHNPVRLTDLNPVADLDNPRVSYEAFQRRTMSYLDGERELARQFGLMVRAEGRFPSYFEGRQIPQRPREEAAGETAEASDPLDEPVGGDPLAGGDEDPIGPDPDAAAGTTEAPAADEPAPIFVARPGARLIVIGDSDFIRDDLVSGAYQQLGGPVSTIGRLFFVNLLDWLAEDRDLFDLRVKHFADRQQRYVTDVGMNANSARRLEEQKDSRVFWVRFLNIALPPLLLIGFGVGLGVMRRIKKQNFLLTLSR